MLDFQQKINADALPTDFIDTQHDAAEFNSAHRELVNAVEAAGLVPTTLPSWATDDEEQLAKSLFIFSGFMLEDITTVTNNYELEPFDPIDTPLPFVSSMDGYTFRFKATMANTNFATLKVFGSTLAFKRADASLLKAGDIQVGDICTVMYSSADTAFLLVDVAGTSVTKITVDSLRKGYLTGFRLMETIIANGTIRVSNGVCTDDADSAVLDSQKLSGPWGSTGMLKRIDATFTPGDDVGGLASNLVLTDNTHYHVFVVRLASGNLDVGFDSDVKAANLIANDNVVEFRRIFTVQYVNAGFGFRRMLQYGDYFLFTEGGQTGPSISIPSGSSIQSSVNTIAPPDVTTIFDIKAFSTTVTNAGFVQITGDKATASAVTSNNFDINVGSSHNPITKRILMDGTNNSVTAASDVNPGTGDLIINTNLIGYWDTRGKDWSNGVGASDARGLFFG